jgi:glycosyltransferase involved in cell wall biosynthesis
MKNKLSICIPNYNRIKCLRNCLESIFQSKLNSDLKFDVCISDNNSDENFDEVVNYYKDKIEIKINKNSQNLGLGINILKSVELSKSEYVWIIGNDDMLLDDCLTRMEYLFNNFPQVDYFFINSYHLSSEFVFSYPQPFDHKNLPLSMKPFSTKNKDVLCNYFELIRPDYSFDFLLGMFLNVFKREKWVQNLDQIDFDLIKDTRVMSNIYNTFPHNIIFAKAFKNSKAFYHSKPLSITLYGERNWWKDLYPFVEAIRIPELVDVYRKNGMGYIRYLICKNFAVRKIISNLLKVAVMPSYNGLQYLNIRNHIIKNLFYPSIYITPVYFLFRKLYKIIINTFKQK